MVEGGEAPITLPLSPLWAHLAQCQKCHQEYTQMWLLLQHLLPTAWLPPPPPRNVVPMHDDGWGRAVVLTATTPSSSMVVPRQSPLLPRWLGVTLVIALIAVPVGMASWFAGVMVRTHQHLSAMIIPTVSASPTTMGYVPVAPSPTTPAHTPMAPFPTTMVGTPIVPSPTMAVRTPVAPTYSPTAPRAVSTTPPASPTIPPITSTTPTTITIAWQATTAPMPLLHRITPIVLPSPTPWPTIQSLPPIYPVSQPAVAREPSPPMALPLRPSHGIAPRATPTSAAVPAPISDRPPLTPQARDRVILLFLGEDRRPDERDAQRTDAILIMLAEPDRNRIALLSLPRDLWVEIPGHGFNRINAAYTWGEISQGPGGGMELARQTVQHLLGIPIDYVTIVDFTGFIGLIDTLGGIPVEVEKELFDASFPTMDYGYQIVHFFPGQQHMDGVTALNYSRIRHPDSDFARMTRQQEVLVGIGKRLRERGDLENLATIDQITRTLVGFVQTTLPEMRMVQLLWTFRDVDPTRVERYTVGGDMVSWGVGGDAYALVVSRPALNALVARFMGEGIRSEVLQEEQY